MLLSAENISLIMGISSFIASIVFFFAAKKSETEAIKILSKIKNQTKSLEKINNNLLDGLINQLKSNNDKFIDSLLPNSQIDSESLAPDDKTTEDVVASNIMVYYYTARANYFSNYVRRHIPLTEENKEIHVTADNVISASMSDFKWAGEWISNIPIDDLKKHNLYPYAVETQKVWEPAILTKKSNPDVTLHS